MDPWGTPAVLRPLPFPPTLLLELALPPAPLGLWQPALPWGLAMATFPAGHSIGAILRTVVLRVPSQTDC